MTFAVEGKYVGTQWESPWGPMGAPWTPIGRNDKQNSPPARATPKCTSEKMLMHELSPPPLKLSRPTARLGLRPQSLMGCVPQGGTACKAPCLDFITGLASAHPSATSTDTEAHALHCLIDLPVLRPQILKRGHTYELLPTDSIGLALQPRQIGRAHV